MKKVKMPKAKAIKITVKPVKKAKLKAIKPKHAMKHKGMGKVEKVMHEYAEGELHSGSKNGPKVSNRKQAVAIALSEARASGAKIPKKRK